MPKGCRFLLCDTTRDKKGRIRVTQPNQNTVPILRKNRNTARFVC